MPYCLRLEQTDGLACQATTDSGDADTSRGLTPPLRQHGNAAAWASEHAGSDWVVPIDNYALSDSKFDGVHGIGKGKAIPRGIRGSTISQRNPGISGIHELHRVLRHLFYHLRISCHLSHA
jgi:hypothetical protein